MRVEVFTVGLETRRRNLLDSSEPDSDWDRDEDVRVLANDAESAIAAAKKHVIGRVEEYDGEGDSEEAYKSEIVEARVASVTSKWLEADIDALAD